MKRGVSPREALDKKVPRRKSTCVEKVHTRDEHLHNHNKALRKDVVSCFKILATSRLRLTEVTEQTVHATSNRDVVMEFTTKKKDVNGQLSRFLLCFYFVHMIFWTKT